MKYATIGWLLAGMAVTTLFHSAVLSTQARVNPQSASRSFTSADGAFRLEYPDSLVSCKRDAKQADWWLPQASCEAFTPVCSDVACNSEGTVVCVAYPADDTTKGTTFQAAAFSVNQLSHTNTESKCLSVEEPPPHVGTSHTEIVNGARFDVTETDGVATGNLMDGYVYSAFHEKKCYELDIRIAYSNVGGDDPAKKVFDPEQVHRRLKAVLDTFRFLKQQTRGRTTSPRHLCYSFPPHGIPPSHYPA
ncbi:MAG TPA: hypothetical protein VJ999_01970 [Candidatus Sulfotelmatobacter sp.]|nr:hypothetical protein [Candidatus Sulfotelmatobacter sp.]